MSVRPALLLPTMLLVFGCAPPPEVPFDSAAKAEIKSDVESRVRGYIQAMMDMDGEYMLGFFADTEDFLYDDHGTPPIGYDEYMEGFTPFLESGSSFESIDVGTLETVVLGPNARVLQPRVFLDDAGWRRQLDQRERDLGVCSQELRWRLEGHPFRRYAPLWVTVLPA